MKKIFFGSLYFIHLLCFNIIVLFFLAVLEVSVLSNLKMIRGIYSENLILIFLNIFLSYFYAKAGIGKKALILLTIIGVILKILISLISYKYLVSSAGDEEFLPTYYAYFLCLFCHRFIGCNISCGAWCKFIDRKEKTV